MTRGDTINNAYFEWLYNVVCEKRYSKKISFRKLLMHLHTVNFVYSIPKDENRAEDGLSLRHRFTYENTSFRGADLYLDRPCSVLEMMVALAIRCEENIMDDPLMGDRKGQWFWSMVTNLGLGSMDDSRYDKLYVAEVIDRFLNREYEPNGKGGLFTVKNPYRDLRDVEIWNQMCWYLDTIT